MLCAVLYPASISTHGLASYAFARHYLRNLFWFLFLTLLRCFSSGGSPHTPIYSVYDTYLLGYVSFLIQTSAAQRIFAPPRSFSQLITSFVGSRCQGIRPALFLAWPFSLKSQSSFFLTFLGFYISQQNFLKIVDFIRLLSEFPLYLSSYLYLSFLLLCIIQFSMCNFPTAYLPTPLLWWAEKDSNLRPLGYQPSALTSWAISPYFHFFSWWRLGGSNSWPPACKAGALPAELNPHSAVLFLKIFFKTFKIKQYLRTKTLRNTTCLCVSRSP